jgi:hypothetical protein
VNAWLHNGIWLRASWPNGSGQDVNDGEPDLCADPSRPLPRMPAILPRRAVLAHALYLAVISIRPLSPLDPFLDRRIRADRSIDTPVPYSERLAAVRLANVAARRP